MKKSYYIIAIIASVILICFSYMNREKNPTLGKNLENNYYENIDNEHHYDEDFMEEHPELTQFDEETIIAE